MKSNQKKIINKNKRKKKRMPKAMTTEARTEQKRMASTTKARKNLHARIERT